MLLPKRFLSHPVYSWEIIYNAETRPLRILRVWHGAQEKQKLRNRELPGAPAYRPDGEFRAGRGEPGRSGRDPSRGPERAEGRGYSTHRSVDFRTF